MASRTFKNVLRCGPFGKAEDLVRQIKLPWEIQGIMKRITIKKRKWKGQTIIQGFQVDTREGPSRACGMNYNDPFNTVTLDVAEDRFISQVRIGAAAYIHSLSFILDNGEILGPVGETGMASETIVPEASEAKSMLCGISGLVVQSYKAPVIAQVNFSFTCE